MLSKTLHFLYSQCLVFPYRHSCSWPLGPFAEQLVFAFFRDGFDDDGADLREHAGGHLDVPEERDFEELRSLTRDEHFGVHVSGRNLGEQGKRRDRLRVFFLFSRPSALSRANGSLQEVFEMVQKL